MLGDLPRQSIDPPFRIGDCINVILEHDLLRRVIKAYRRQPASISLGPGPDAGIDPPVSQEEPTKVLTRLGQHLHRCRTGSSQVAHRFMGGVGNPNFGEASPTSQHRAGPF
jgi:hypothetical protein